MVCRVVSLVVVLIAAELALGGGVPGSGATSPDGSARAYLRTAQTGNYIPGPAGTEALSKRFFTGSNAYDAFGFSVAGAGDVNGDGYDDLIIGAPRNDAGGNDAGRVYIYFGGRSMSSSPDVVLTGTADDTLGRCVAGAGDVNGDGYDDVIVGAFSSPAGDAYIYFGGPVMDAVVDVILTGEVADDLFGYSLAGGGDVNGDGFADVIVGAYRSDAAGTDAGSAYIYFGGVAMDALADVTLRGASAGDHFGRRVAGAGDVNRDGYADVIVGAPLNDAGGTDAGRAYLYFGGPSMDPTADAMRTGGAAGDQLGWSVAGAGDVNGDGYADVIVGAPYNDLGGVDAGAGYIAYGTALGFSKTSLTLTGEAASDCFGYSVAGAGDVNGDGWSDVIVGAYYNGVGGSRAGRAYVYLGARSMDTRADIVVTGEAADDNFGVSVAAAGDVNGDGYGDVLVGAYKNDAGGYGAGRAYLFENSMTGADLPDEVLTPEFDAVYFGFSVAAAGDVNGDGYGDVIVGSPSDVGGGTDTGRVCIYFGGPGMDTDADVILTGQVFGDAFGRSVGGAGDVNGDGYDDVIVGAPQNDAGGVDAGRAYIYFGGAAMDRTADVVLTGAAAGDYFGCSVAGAGDVNGNGTADVVVGARYSDGDGTDAGRAYVFFGGPAMNATADVILEAEAAGDDYGISVAGAGDVNGDRYADVIVGAPRNNSGVSDAGRAYLYFGGPSMNAVADVVVTGAEFSDLLGSSVACAGDVNGDGYDDFVVGALSGGAENAGGAYIYFGGTRLDAIADVTLLGERDGDLYGYSVGSAGDVNGDGYGDVIVGAIHNGAAIYNAGRAYIYLGSPAMDAAADIVMTGEGWSDYLGSSVASPGDLNSDGYDDVVVGALGDGKGTVSIYLSSPPPVLPRISDVVDVPFDQGGKVTLRWYRSGYDVRGINKISSYELERSRPPGLSGFAWESVGSVLPAQRSLYELTIDLPTDSMAGNSGTYYFQVTASTLNPDEYWRSNIVSGHSVDNLPPAAVGYLSATAVTTSTVRLRWPANRHDPDLGAFVVYRSVTNGFVPGESNQLLALTDTTYLDSALPTASIVYYRVRARDIHGNLGGLSPQAAVAPASTQNYAVSTSWNMISVPMDVDDYAKSVLYPTAISDAFAYSGGYVTRSTLENGTGYWLKFPSAQSVPMTGFALVADTIPVVSGWNMVGSIGAPLPATQVTSNPGGLVVSPFYSYASGYAASATIEPHKGYWVKVQQAGELILSLNGPMGGAVQIVETAERPPNPPDMVSVGTEAEIPIVFSLSQNYPNPFNPTTVIRYGLPQKSTVDLAVYNALGQLVAVLVAGEVEAGYHEVRLDAMNLASGLYLCRFSTGSFVQTRKLMLVR